MQPERSRPQGSRKFSPNKWLKPQILLVFSIFGLIYRPAQIARACGRVSVGADPDKRPVKRRIKTGSRRRTGEPRLHGGSRLKATTDRAFLVSVGPSKGRQPKRLVFLAGRADRDLPFQTMATLTATERLRTPSRNLETPSAIRGKRVHNGAPPDRPSRALPADAGPGCGSTACPRFHRAGRTESQPRS